MGLFKPNVEKLAARGDVKGLVKALKNKVYILLEFFRRSGLDNYTRESTIGVRRCRTP